MGAFGENATNLCTEKYHIGAYNSTDTQNYISIERIGDDGGKCFGFFTEIFRFYIVCEGYLPLHNFRYVSMFTNNYPLN